MNTAAKILIVDDNPSIHDIMGKLFYHGDDGATHTILHADNGQEALSVLNTTPDIDVVVLDLDMPVMNGFETLSHILADLRLQAIPVCVFSSSKDDSTKALKLGARDYIIKPGDYQEIKIRVLNLIDGKRRAEASEQAKIHFLATVSHELRTPMSGVMGAAQLLQMTEMTDKQSRYVELIDESASNILAIINNCLGFLQSENPLHNLPAVAFSLRSTVLKSIGSLANAAEKNGVAMEAEIHPDLPDHLSGLPDKIAVIFHHLLSNAIKFSPAGKVVVRIEPGLRDETSVQLRCSVIDTGVGISPEQHSSIFEPFTQADGSNTRAFGGLGIGLSIASRMVQMMGGAIHVESGSSGGSTFRFAVGCGIVAASV